MTDPNDIIQFTALPSLAPEVNLLAHSRKHVQARALTEPGPIPHEWMPNVLYVGDFLGRIHLAMNSGWPSLKKLDAAYLGETLIIAGGGPGLRDALPEIRRLHRKRGVKIIAPNKSHDFLVANGITPDFGVLIDWGSHVAGYIKRWQKRNKARRKRHSRVYYLKNKDKINRVATAWGKAHPEKKRESNRKFYANNAKAMCLRSIRYAAENPVKIRSKAARRRAMEISQVHPCHDQTKECILIESARSLSSSTGIKHSVDHIIPLKKGGWHHHDNLQVMPHTVNSSKNSNPFWEKKGFKSWRDVPQFLWPYDLKPKYFALLGATGHQGMVQS